LPKYLGDQGIAQVIAPLPTTHGQPWASLDDWTVILYPFVEGRDGYEVALSARQWAEFGAALKRIHTLDPPAAIRRAIAQETYSPQWRERTRIFLERAEDQSYADPIAQDLSEFLRTRCQEILELIERAEQQARVLQAQSPDLVLCHSDIHAGNLLIGTDGALYIVDWDAPILAPKERDLMFIGGAQGFRGYTAQEEETLFFRGYGQTQIDRIALAYYRSERIIEDIAVFCEQIFLSDEGERDRAQSLHYLKSNFLPNGTIAVANRTV
jgi:spectinomycin phosphotransferase